MNIAIIGRTEILYRCIELLEQTNHKICIIITSKEAPEYKIKSEDFKSKSSQLGVKFIHTSNIYSAVNDLKSIPNLDLAVSINYSGVIPEVVTSLFRIGILNVHGGDLPKYKGNACQAWALINGEDKIGLCVHKMIGGELDNGDIITRDYMPIDINTKITQIWEWIEKRSPDLIINAIDLLNNNPQYILERQSKDPKDSLRCYPRIPDDGKINWSKSSKEILRLINASNKPYTGAYCYFEGKKITIWDAELIFDLENFCAIPGQVTKIGENFIEVACGIGKLRIFSIEFSNEILNPSMLIKSIRKRLN